jgi:hypothetical protein
MKIDTPRMTPTDVLFHLMKVYNLPVPGLFDTGVRPANFKDGDVLCTCGGRGLEHRFESVVICDGCDGKGFNRGGPDAKMA